MHQDLNKLKNIFERLSNLSGQQVDLHAVASVIDTPLKPVVGG